MNLQGFEIVERNFKHEIFDEITIYKDFRTHSQYFSKTLPFEGNYESIVENLKKRLSLNSPYLMKMVSYVIQEKTKEIVLYFSYPVSNLDTRTSQLKTLNERIKFLKDILNALMDLQGQNMIHGNLTFSHIYYDEIQENYFIVDRINHMKETSYAYLRSYGAKDLVSLSPLLYQNSQNPVAYENPLISDVFSLGMIFLQHVIGKEKVEALYDLENRKFDLQLFDSLKEELKTFFFKQKQDQLLIEFLKHILLNETSYLRSTPDKALQTLQQLQTEKMLIIQKNINLKKQINPSYGKYVGFLGNYYQPQENQIHFSELIQKKVEKMEPSIFLKQRQIPSQNEVDLIKMQLFPESSEGNFSKARTSNQQMDLLEVGESLEEQKPKAVEEIQEAPDSQSQERPEANVQVGQNIEESEQKVEDSTPNLEESQVETVTKGRKTKKSVFVNVESMTEEHKNDIANLLLSEAPATDKKKKKKKKKKKVKQEIIYIKEGTEEYDYIISQLGITLKPSEQIIKIGDQYEIIEYIIEEEIEDLQNQLKRLVADEESQQKNKTLIDDLTSKIQQKMNEKLLQKQKEEVKVEEQQNESELIESNKVEEQTDRQESQNLNQVEEIQTIEQAEVFANQITGEKQKETTEVNQLIGNLTSLEGQETRLVEGGTQITTKKSQTQLIASDLMEVVETQITTSRSQTKIIISEIIEGVETQIATSGSHTKIISGEQVDGGVETQIVEKQTQTLVIQSEKQQGGPGKDNKIEVEVFSIQQSGSSSNLQGNNSSSQTRIEEIAQPKQETESDLLVDAEPLEERKNDVVQRSPETLEQETKKERYRVASEIIQNREIGNILKCFEQNVSQIVIDDVINLAIVNYQKKQETQPEQQELKDSETLYQRKSFDSVEQDQQTRKSLKRMSQLILSPNKNQYTFEVQNSEKDEKREGEQIHLDSNQENYQKSIQKDLHHPAEQEEIPKRLTFTQGKSQFEFEDEDSQFFEDEEIIRINLPFPSCQEEIFTFQFLKKMDKKKRTRKSTFNINSIESFAFSNRFSMKQVSFPTSIKKPMSLKENALPSLSDKDMNDIFDQPITVNQQNQFDDYFEDCFSEKVEEGFKLTEEHKKKGVVSIEEVKKFIKEETKASQPRSTENFWIHHNNKKAKKFSEKQYQVLEKLKKQKRDLEKSINYLIYQEKAPNKIQSHETESSYPLKDQKRASNPKHVIKCYNLTMQKQKKLFQLDFLYEVIYRKMESSALGDSFANSESNFSSRLHSSKQNQSRKLLINTSSLKVIKNSTKQQDLSVSHSMSQIVEVVDDHLYDSGIKPQELKLSLNKTKLLQSEQNKLQNFNYHSNEESQKLIQSQIITSQILPGTLPQASQKIQSVYQFQQPHSPCIILRNPSHISGYHNILQNLKRKKQLQCLNLYSICNTKEDPDYEIQHILQLAQYKNPRKLFLSQNFSIIKQKEQRQYMTIQTSLFKQKSMSTLKELAPNEKSIIKANFQVENVFSAIGWKDDVKYFDSQDQTMHYFLEKRLIPKGDPAKVNLDMEDHFLFGNLKIGLVHQESSSVPIEMEKEEVIEQEIAPRSELKMDDHLALSIVKGTFAHPSSLVAPKDEIEELVIAKQDAPKAVLEIENHNVFIHLKSSFVHPVSIQDPVEENAEEMIPQEKPKKPELLIDRKYQFYQSKNPKAHPEYNSVATETDQDLIIPSIVLQKPSLEMEDHNLYQNLKSTFAFSRKSEDLVVEKKVSMNSQSIQHNSQVKIEQYNIHYNSKNTLIQIQQNDNPVEAQQEEIIKELAQKTPLNTESYIACSQLKTSFVQPEELKEILLEKRAQKTPLKTEGYIAWTQLKTSFVQPEEPQEIILEERAQKTPLNTENYIAWTQLKTQDVQPEQPKEILVPERAQKTPLNTESYITWTQLKTSFVQPEDPEVPKEILVKEKTQKTPLNTESYIACSQLKTSFVQPEEPKEILVAERARKTPLKTEGFMTWTQLKTSFVQPEEPKEILGKERAQKTPLTTESYIACCQLKTSYDQPQEPKEILVQEKAQKTRLMTESYITCTQLKTSFVQPKEPQEIIHKEKAQKTLFNTESYISWSQLKTSFIQPQIPKEILEEERAKKTLLNTERYIACSQLKTFFVQPQEPKEILVAEKAQKTPLNTESYIAWTQSKISFVQPKETKEILEEERAQKTPLNTESFIVWTQMKTSLIQPEDPKEILGKERVQKIPLTKESYIACSQLKTSDVQPQEPEKILVAERAQKTPLNTVNYIAWTQLKISDVQPEEPKEILVAERAQKTPLNTESYIAWTQLKTSLIQPEEPKEIPLEEIVEVISTKEPLKPELSIEHQNLFLHLKNTNVHPVMKHDLLVVCEEKMVATESPLKGSLEQEDHFILLQRKDFEVKPQTIEEVVLSKEEKRIQTETPQKAILEMQDQHFLLNFQSKFVHPLKNDDPVEAEELLLIPVGKNPKPQLSIKHHNLLNQLKTTVVYPETKVDSVVVCEEKMVETETPLKETLEQEDYFILLKIKDAEVKQQIIEEEILVKEEKTIQTEIPQKAILEMKHEHLLLNLKNKFVHPQTNEDPQEAQEQLFPVEKKLKVELSMNHHNLFNQLKNTLAHPETKHDPVVVCEEKMVATDTPIKTSLEQERYFILLKTKDAVVKAQTIEEVVISKEEKTIQTELPQKAILEMKDQHLLQNFKSKFVHPLTNEDPQEAEEQLFPVEKKPKVQLSMDTHKVLYQVKNTLAHPETNVDPVVVCEEKMVATESLLKASLEQENYFILLKTKDFKIKPLVIEEVVLIKEEKKIQTEIPQKAILEMKDQHLLLNLKNKIVHPWTNEDPVEAEEQLFPVGKKPKVELSMDAHQVLYQVKNSLIPPWTNFDGNFQGEELTTLKERPKKASLEIEDQNSYTRLKSTFIHPDEKEPQFEIVEKQVPKEAPSKEELVLEDHFIYLKIKENIVSPQTNKPDVVIIQELVTTREISQKANLEMENHNVFTNLKSNPILHDIQEVESNTLGEELIPKEINVKPTLGMEDLNLFIKMKSYAVSPLQTIVQSELYEEEFKPKEKMKRADLEIETLYAYNQMKSDVYSSSQNRVHSELFLSSQNRVHSEVNLYSVEMKQQPKKAILVMENHQLFIQEKNEVVSPLTEKVVKQAPPKANLTIDSQYAFYQLKSLDPTPASRDQNLDNQESQDSPIDVQNVEQMNQTSPQKRFYENTSHHVIARQLRTQHEEKTTNTERTIPILETQAFNQIVAIPKKLKQHSVQPIDQFCYQDKKQVLPKNQQMQEISSFLFKKTLKELNQQQFDNVLFIPHQKKVVEKQPTSQPLNLYSLYFKGEKPQTLISNSNNYLSRLIKPVQRQQTRFIVFINFKESSQNNSQSHDQSQHASLQKVQEPYKTTVAYRYLHENQKSDSEEEQQIIGDFLKPQKFNIKDIYDLILQRKKQNSMIAEEEPLKRAQYISTEKIAEFNTIRNTQVIFSENNQVERDLRSTKVKKSYDVEESYTQNIQRKNMKIQMSRHSLQSMGSLLNMLPIHTSGFNQQEKTLEESDPYQIFTKYSRKFKGGKKKNREFESFTIIDEEMDMRQLFLHILINRRVPVEHIQVYLNKFKGRKRNLIIDEFPLIIAQQKFYSEKYIDDLPVSFNQYKVFRDHKISSPSRSISQQKTPADEKVPKTSQQFNLVSQKKTKIPKGDHTVQTIYSESIAIKSNPQKEAQLKQFQRNFHFQQGKSEVQTSSQRSFVTRNLAQVNILHNQKQKMIQEPQLRQEKSFGDQIESFFIISRQKTPQPVELKTLSSQLIRTQAIQERQKVMMGISPQHILSQEKSQKPVGCFEIQSPFLRRNPLISKRRKVVHEISHQQFFSKEKTPRNLSTIDVDNLFSNKKIERHKYTIEEVFGVQFSQKKSKMFDSFGPALDSNRQVINRLSFDAKQVLSDKNLHEEPQKKESFSYKQQQRGSKRVTFFEQKLNKRVQTDFFPFEIQEAYQLLLIPKLDEQSKFSMKKLDSFKEQGPSLKSKKDLHNQELSQSNTNLYEHLRQLQEQSLKIQRMTEESMEALKYAESKVCQNCWCQIGECFPEKRQNQNRRITFGSEMVVQKQLAEFSNQFLGNSEKRKLEIRHNYHYLGFAIPDNQIEVRRTERAESNQFVENEMSHRLQRKQENQLIQETQQRQSREISESRKSPNVFYGADDDSSHRIYGKVQNIKNERKKSKGSVNTRDFYDIILSPMRYRGPQYRGKYPQKKVQVGYRIQNSSTTQNRQVYSQREANVSKDPFQNEEEK